jgi:hypothetical protein
MIKTNNKAFILVAISSLLGLQTAQASSTFSSNSTVSITIDSISNNTNAGQFLGLDIFGSFDIADPVSAPGFGKIVSGDGNSTYSHLGGSLDSSIAPVNAGDSFNQLFSASGSVNSGTVDAYYQAFGGLEFINNTSDNFTIGYTLSYDLNTLVSGDFATNTVGLEYFNDLGDIFGYEESVASTPSPSINQNLLSKSFNLNLGAFQSDMFYADVSVTAYAESTAVAPVPVPAAGWLMLSGLAFLRSYRKSAA